MSEGYQVDFFVEDATDEQITRILLKFIEAVEEEGLICGGGASSVRETSKPESGV